MTFTKTEFGRTPDGQPVDLYTLENSRGMRATLTNFGGVLIALELPDPSNGTTDVVLGFDSLASYLDNPPFFGALVGRYGNRLRGGNVEIAGEPYQLECNDGPNHLHGGPGGFHRVLWQAEAAESRAGDQLDLRHVSSDGEQGYPGTLEVHVRYSLGEDDALCIDYEARTDRATLVNLTHHSYFNLAGHASGTIDRHQLRVFADQFTPTDEHQIPTGELASVAGTAFDFRTATPLGERLGWQDRQLQIGLGYDHNFVINDWDGTLRPVAEVIEPISGRRMLVQSTEPGLQLYSGNRLQGIRGKGGHVYQARAGFCLEAQHFPDSPHHAHFPSTLLTPGQVYRQTTRYAFVDR